MNRFLLFIFLFPYVLLAQNSYKDSLKLALKNAKHDTTRCNILNELIDSENDDKVWPKYNDQLLRLAKYGSYKSSTDTTRKLFYLKHLAGALNNIGFLAQTQGDIPKAIDFYLKSLKIEEEIKNKKGIAYSLNNIGSIYKDQGDISKGLEYYHKSLKIREEINDKKGIANALNNIGIIHKNQGDAKKGLEYYNRSLKIWQEIDDKHGIGASLNNIGFIYDNHGDPTCHSSKEICYAASQEKALEYYFMSLKIRTEINDKHGVANSLNNIGGVYSNLAAAEKKLGNTNQEEQLIKKALDHYQQALIIQEEIKDKSGIATSLINIGIILQNQGKLMAAFTMTSKSLKISKELGFPRNIMSAASALKVLFKKQNKLKEALEMYELEIQMRDSINNSVTKKASVKKQFQYEYEKKAAADSVKHAEEQKVKNALLQAQKAQLKQEKTQRLALYGGLGLIIAFLGFIVNRFRITQRQKAIIEKQKVLVDEAYGKLHEKNKEIIDSITYAQRIQRALITSERYIDHTLNRLSDKE
jgi:tetratricopeptide (TPR) repeat protein